MTKDDPAFESERLFMASGVALAVEKWNRLEQALATLLAAVLQPKDDPMAFAVYYSPSNTETRLAIVNNTIAQIPLLNADTPRFKACWAILFAKINRAKNTRNKIVHGQVVTVTRRGRARCRMISPLLDNTRESDMVVSIVAGQLPGMSADDVHKAARVFNGRADQCYLAMGAISAMRRNPGAPQAWQKTLAELESCLNLPQQNKVAQSGARP